MLRFQPAKQETTAALPKPNLSHEELVREEFALRIVEERKVQRKAVRRESFPALLRFSVVIATIPVMLLLATRSQNAPPSVASVPTPVEFLPVTESVPDNVLAHPVWDVTGARETTVGELPMGHEGRLQVFQVDLPTNARRAPIPSVNWRVVRTQSGTYVCGYAQSGFADTVSSTVIHTYVVPFAVPVRVFLSGNTEAGGSLLRLPESTYSAIEVPPQSGQ